MLGASQASADQMLAKSSTNAYSLSRLRHATCGEQRTEGSERRG
jgi:hypothetical protein